MTQPPGGYPPPPQDPSSGPVPGSYPPPAQPGGYPAPPSGPAPQYGPPGGYPPQAPPPAPGQPAGPPPGFAPPPAPGQGQVPPPGYHPGQTPPAYGPPGQAPAGYGPPGSGQQPGAYPPAGYGPPGQPAATPSFDPKSVTTAGWGVLGSAVLLLIASFFPFWSVRAAGFYSFGLSGWSSWWWLPILLGLAVGVGYLLLLMGVLKPNQVKPEWLAYGAAGVAVLLVGVLLHTFFAGGGGYGYLDQVSAGPSFGVFFALVVGLALAYFTALAAQERGARLPITVPGPMKRS